MIELKIGSKEDHIFIVGQRANDKMPVVAGLGRLYFQEGIPLSIVFDGCKKNNCQPSFPHLYMELKGNGMTHERIIHLLSEQIFESYGGDYRDKVIERLEVISKHIQ